MPAGTRLDLGATAKAWAADRAAARIAETVGGGVLVGLGGDIAVAGQAPPGGWRIRVQDVTGRPQEIPHRLSAVVLSPAAAWLPPVPPRDAGGAAATCCTTSLTRVPAPAGAGLADDLGHRRDVRGRQRGQYRGHDRGDRAPGWLARIGLPARLVSVNGEVETVAGWPLRPCQPGEAQ